LNVLTPFILKESQWLFYTFSKLRTLLYSIASLVKGHPRVASLAASRQFTFRGTARRRWWDSKPALFTDDLIDIGTVSLCFIHIYFYLYMLVVFGISKSL
jgi:hypothetical protein